MVKLLHANLLIPATEEKYLVAAASMGDFETFKYYLENSSSEFGINITIQDSCLKGSIKSENPKMVTLLISELGWSGFDLIEFSFRNNRMEMAVLLKDLGVEFSPERVMIEAISGPNLELWESCYAFCGGLLLESFFGVAFSNLDPLPLLKWLCKKGLRPELNKHEDTLVSFQRIDLLEFFEKELEYKPSDDIIDWFLRYRLTEEPFLRFLLLRSRPDYEIKLQDMIGLLSKPQFLRVLKDRGQVFSRLHVADFLCNSFSNQMKRVIEGVMACGFHDFDEELIALVKSKSQSEHQTYVAITALDEYGRKQPKS